MHKLSETIFYLSVGVGMALSTSAFTMFGGMFEVAPLREVVVGIVIAGAVCIAIALSIGELASLWPSAPAIRTFFKMAFGDRASLVLVYLYLVFIVLIAGVESYMFALVVGAMMPAVPPLATVVSLLVAVIAANAFGLDLPRQMQVLTTAVCLAIVVIMGVTGVLVSDHVTGGPALPALQSLATVPAAVGLAIFLFIGFEWISPVGLRPGAYERQIPCTMVGAVAVLMIGYVAFAIGIGVALPRHQIASEPIPQVPYFMAVLGPGGVWVAGLLSLTAIFSTFNAGLMGGSRLLQAMARERTLPKVAALLNPYTGAPLGAALLLGSSALIASLVIVQFKLHLLAAVIGAVIICFIYGAYMLAVLRLRRQQPELRRPFRTPLPEWLQWLVGILLPLIGLATLFSIPEFGSAPALGLLAFSLVSLALSEWSLRRRTAAEPHRIPASAVRPQRGHSGA